VFIALSGIHRIFLENRYLAWIPGIFAEPEKEYIIMPVEDYNGCSILHRLYFIYKKLTLLFCR
jgi:hypothetical protein